MKRMLTATALTSVLLLGACSGKDKETTKDLEKEK